MRPRSNTRAWSPREDLDLLELLQSAARRHGDVARFARQVGRQAWDVRYRAAWLQARRRPDFSLPGVIIDDCPLPYAVRARLLLEVPHGR